MAACLMERGASLSRISDLVFNSLRPALRALGRGANPLSNRERLVWADITGEMLDRAGATLEDADSWSILWRESRVPVARFSSASKTAECGSA